LDEKRVETSRKHEKAALERDAVAQVQNQLVTQIEILGKSQSTLNQGQKGLGLPCHHFLQWDHPYREQS